MKQVHLFSFPETQTDVYNYTYMDEWHHDKQFRIDKIKDGSTRLRKLNGAILTHLIPHVRIHVLMYEDFAWPKFVADT